MAGWLGTEADEQGLDDEPVFKFLLFLLSYVPSMLTELQNHLQLQLKDPATSSRFQVHYTHVHTCIHAHTHSHAHTHRGRETERSTWN